MTNIFLLCSAYAYHELWSAMLSYQLFMPAGSVTAGEKLLVLPTGARPGGLLETERGKDSGATDLGCPHLAAAKLLVSL